MADLSVEELKQVVQDVLAEMKEEADDTVSVGISAHHVHLTEEHFAKLFPNEKMEVYKPLKQPGEYATKFVVDLIGPKGTLKHVRVLGPCRWRSQVELSKTDARTLGIEAPIRLSGNLDDAAPVTIKTEKAEITVPAAIVAKRHIHMSFKDSERLNLRKGDIVSVEVGEAPRNVVFHDVEIRPGEDYVLEMHVDTDEANAANLKPGSLGKIIR